MFIVAHDFNSPSRRGSAPCILSLVKNYQRFQHQPVKIWTSPLKLAWEIEIAGETIYSYERNKKHMTTADYMEYILFSLGIFSSFLFLYLIYRHRKEWYLFFSSPNAWRKTHRDDFE